MLHSKNKVIHRIQILRYNARYYRWGSLVLHSVMEVPVSVCMLCAQNEDCRGHARCNTVLAARNALGFFHGWFGMNMGSLGIQKPLAAAKISDYPTFSDVTP